LWPDAFGRRREADACKTNRASKSLTPAGIIAKKHPAGQRFCDAVLSAHPNFMKGIISLALCAMAFLICGFRTQGAAPTDYFKVSGHWDDRRVGPSSTDTNATVTNTGFASIHASLSCTNDIAAMNPYTALTIDLGSSNTGAGVAIFHYLGDDTNYTVNRHTATFTDFNTNGPGKLTTTVSWTSSRLKLSCRADFDLFSAGLNYTNQGTAVIPDVFNTNMVKFPGIIFTNLIFVTAKNTSNTVSAISDSGSLSGSADFTPPVVKITSPINNSTTTNPILIVFGITSDNIEASQLPPGSPYTNTLSYSTNGGDSYAPIAGSTNGQPDYFDGTNWATPAVNLIAGTNTIDIRATDASGNNSVAKSVTVTYKPVSPITLRVALDADGGADGSITRSVTNEPNVLVGTMATITAVPYTNFVFNGWTESNVYGPLPSSQKNPLTFTMSSNLVLTANFTSATNFTNASGDYTGLFFATHIDATSNVFTDPTNSGYFSLDVTSAGAYGGVLTMLSGRYPFSGQLAFMPSNSFYTHLEVARGKLPALTVQFGISGGAITNDLGDNTNAMVGSASLFGTISDPGQSYLNGTYNVAIPAVSFPSNTIHGNSYGILTVTNKASARLVMYLADSALNGGAVTSGTLATNGAFPFFIPLHSGKNGLLMGELTIATNSASTNAITATNVTWIKLPGASKTYYPDGFNVGGLGLSNSLAMTGSSYSFRNEFTNAFSNTITITNLDLANTNITAEVSFATNGAVSVATNDYSIKIAHFYLDTGLISGTFAPDPLNKARTLPFKALFLLNGSFQDGQAYGYFIDTNVTGTVEFDPPQ
jgi:hypothetical protein